MNVPKILVVDDQEVDLKLVRNAFLQASRPVNVVTALGATEAWSMIQQGQDFDLILLDINMPGMNGKELLSLVKGNRSHAHTIVVMFTSSENDPDITECYQLGANSYICKEESQVKLRQLADNILHYWFDISKVPERRNI